MALRNSATTLLTLVNDLLDVAKAESGRLRVDPAQVNLPALLARLHSLVRPLADASKVSLIVSSEDAPQTILTDELTLTGILRNLLSNGIKYTNRGEVRLTGADLEAFSNHLMSLFGPREDDVAMIALRRSGPA